MGLKEIIEKFKSMKNKLEPDEDIPDDVTRDKYLRSLRRERRVQMEEVEKEQLKKDIEAYKKARTRKYLWGVKDDIQVNKKKMLLAKLKDKKKINLLNEKKQRLKNKAKKSILSENSSWLNRHNL